MGPLLILNWSDIQIENSIRTATKCNALLLLMLHLSTKNVEKELYFLVILAATSGTS